MEVWSIKFVNRLLSDFFYPFCRFAVYNTGEMAAFEWREIKGLEFSAEEAGGASDFAEVLREWHLDPDAAYSQFSTEKLTVGQRLFFAEKASTDIVAGMVVSDPDQRIGLVVKKRLEEERGGGLVEA